MAELIKISELASRAGVEKSTIQHYIREGLIPQPENRPHRNMHYYRADLVERIKLIKDLQQRRNFPLSKIREVLADEHLADERGIEQIREYLYSAPAPLDLVHAKPITRGKLIDESGLTGDALDRLEERGFIQSKRKGTAVTYDPVDAAIVHACASMQRAGLNETNGFTLDELKMYVVAMRELISKEMMLFARIVDNHTREEIVEMAQRGFEGTNTLILNLRRKLFLKVLGDARQSLRAMEGKSPRRKQE
ncbi:MAG: MerR family transcriptional regulator [Kofleriaceae bacterium]